MEKWLIWDEVEGEIFVDEIGSTDFNSAIKEGLKRWEQMPTADKNRRIRYEVCTGIFDDEEGLDIETVELQFTIKGNSPGAHGKYKSEDDVIRELKEENGSFVDEYNDEYVLLEQAYIDGPADAPYYTALAINRNNGRDNFGCYPVYQVTWNPLEEWLDGDWQEEGDACDWEHPAEVKETDMAWDPEELWIK